MTYPTPLEGSWRSRWLVLGSWNRLHRIAEGEWDETEWCVPNGRTACGRTGRLVMPGIISRMSTKRCSHCCNKTGIPPGHGAPFNEFAKHDPRRDA